MRHAFLIVLIALVVCCTSVPKPFSTPVVHLVMLPRLGDVLPDLPPTRTGTMVAPSQTRPSYDAVVDGVTFTIGVDREQRVRFVATNDASFAGVDGLKIGDSLDAAVRAGASAVRFEGGWGSFVRLPSGWFAFLDDSTTQAPNLGTAPLGPNARITMFFMRD